MSTRVRKNVKKASTKAVVCCYLEKVFIEILIDSFFGKFRAIYMTLESVNGGKGASNDASICE